MNLPTDRFTASPGNWIDFDVQEEIDFDDGRVKLLGPISVSGKGMALGEIFKLKGRLKGRLSCVCDRCCDDFYRDIDLPFTAEYAKKKQDDDQFLFEGIGLGLDDMVIHHVLLSLPMQLLCKDDCLGICSQCYANKNRQECLCK